MLEMESIGQNKWLSLSFLSHMHSIRQDKRQFFTEYFSPIEETYKKTFYQYELLIFFPLNVLSTYYVLHITLSTENQQKHDIHGFASQSLQSNRLNKIHMITHL